MTKAYKGKKMLCILLSVALLLALAACGGDDAPSEPEEVEVGQSGNEALLQGGGTYSEDDTWAIYWYLCGSDLETNFGFASDDIGEMMKVTLPDNVRVVIQAGGAEEWENENIDPENATRLLYAGSELSVLGEASPRNMGDAETLAEFLEFCLENYPADRQAVILWNHGGGSLSGVAFDEQFDDDSLSLQELNEAFGAVCEPSEENPPFELVGFDACLMATVETAASLNGYARYMVASEETEPGCGWAYDGFFKALAADTRMNGAQLGAAICDTYAEACNQFGLAKKITLSVVDLTRIGPLLAAYGNMGMEALAAACEEPQFFTRMGRNVDTTEKYGSNSRDEGYTNMVDLGDYARSTADMLPDNAQAVLTALENCVAYKINGPYRAQSSGLSCYYPFDMDEDSLEDYTEVATSEALLHLYDYAVTGKLSEKGAQYAYSMAYEELPDYPQTALQPVEEMDELPEVPTIDLSELAGHPVDVEGGYAVLDLGAERADYLSAVYFELAYIDPETDLVMLLGRDNDVEADWENGVFRDNFRGVWGAIDGYYVYMRATYIGEEYCLYSVPILLNGEEYNLSISYTYELEEWEILGAMRGLDESGMADKNLLQLQVGDEIQTIHFVMSLSGDGDDVEQVALDTFTVTQNTAFDDAALGDGLYVLMFDMVDGRGNSAYADIVQVTIEEGEIYID